MATKHDLAASISLDIQPLVDGATAARRELALIEQSLQQTGEATQQLAKDLATTANTVSQTQAATFANSAIQPANVSTTSSLDQPIASVNESVSASAVEAEAELSRVDAALEQTRSTAAATGDWIKENPLLTFSLVNAASKAAGAGSLVGAAASAGSSLATAAMTAIGVSVVATALTVTGLAAGFVLLGQLIPTGRIDDLAASLGVARNDTELLTVATMQLIEAQQSGASAEVVAASFQAADTQRGRAAAMPTIDTRQAALATAIGGKAEDAVKIAGQIVYQIDVPTLEATATEARRSVATIAQDLAKVSASTQGAGWGQISALSAIANLSDASVQDLGTSVEELRLRAHSNGEAFAALGINVLTAEGTLQSSAAVAQQFAAAMDGMSAAERTAAMESLGLSASTKAVVTDLAKQATAISESRDAITANNALTADQEQARIGNQLSALTTMAEAVGSRLKNWSDATIEAVSRPVSKAAADLTEWVGGGVATSLQTLDGWLAQIESTVTRVDVSQLTLLGEQPDASKAASEPPPPKPIKVPLAEWQTKLSPIDDATAAIAKHEQTLRDLDASYETGGMTLAEYGTATRNVTAAIDAARGGGQAKIADLTRQIELIQMATDAERERSKLTLSGMAPETVDQTMAQEARKVVEKQLADLRERERAVGETEAQARTRGLIDVEATPDQIGLVQSDLARVAAKEELAAIQRENIKLGQTEAEQRRAELAGKGLDSAGIQAVEAARQENEAKKRSLELQKEIRQLQGIPEPKVVSSPEIDALEADRDRIKQQKADQDLAKQLAEQYDPTIRIKQQREELDRLRDSIGEVAYANGVKALDEQWQNATKSARQHREEINKGLQGTAAVDAVFQRIAMGDGLLTGMPPGPNTQPLKPGPLVSPPQPSVTLPTPQSLPKPQLAESRDSVALKEIATTLAQMLTKLDEMSRSETDTERNTRDIADGLQVR